MNSQNSIFVFPGQGSQHSGMAAEFMTHPTTRILFEEANDALGFDLAKLMQSGSEDELRQTQNTQPALLAAGYIAYKYLESQTGKSLTDLTSYVAGHSVGEYTAACVAGCLTFTQALQLVRARGEAMAKACPEGEGAMAAVLGGTWADVSSTCETTGCFIANDNSEGQQVISGPMAAIDEASNMLVMQEVKKVVRLNVAGPFHTRPMHPAAEEVAGRLADMDVQNAQVPIIMNATAMATTDAATITKNLVTQITSTVRWRECMEAAAEGGATELYEFGAGKVLCGLAKRCDARLAATKQLDTPFSVDDMLEAQEAAA